MRCWTDAAVPNFSDFFPARGIELLPYFLGCKYFGSVLTACLLFQLEITVVPCINSGKFCKGTETDRKEKQHFTKRELYTGTQGCKIIYDTSYFM